MADERKSEPPDRDKDKAMLDFGLQGKAELSQIVVAVAVGIFGILVLFTNPLSLPQWLALTTAYWGIFFLGIWAYGTHQLFATVADEYVKKYNPNFDQDLGRLSEQNFMAKWAYDRFWKKAPYPKQRRRVILSLIAYSGTALFLFVAFASNAYPK